MSRDSKTGLLLAQQAGGDRDGNNQKRYDDYSLSLPPLSRQSLKNLYALAGELSDYYLERCHELIDCADSDFNRPFSMLITCLDLQSCYLEKLNV